MTVVVPLGEMEPPEPAEEVMVNWVKVNVAVTPIFPFTVKVEGLIEPVNDPLQYEKTQPAEGVAWS